MFIRNDRSPVGSDSTLLLRINLQKGDGRRVSVGSPLSRQSKNMFANSMSGGGELRLSMFVVSQGWGLLPE